MARRTPNNLFDTPDYVAEYMIGLIDEEPRLVLEPAVGDGRLLQALWRRFPNTRVIGYDVRPVEIADDRLEFRQTDFLEAPVLERPDLILSNPPYSPKALYAKFIQKGLSVQARGIYLVPWFYLINSSYRPRTGSRRFDLRRVVNLPRETFPSIRTQVCILDLYPGETSTTTLEWYNPALWVAAPPDR